MSHDLRERIKLDWESRATDRAEILNRIQTQREIQDRLDADANRIDTIIACGCVAGLLVLIVLQLVEMAGIV